MSVFDILNPDTNRSGDCDSVDVDSSNESVPRKEPPTQFIGELQRPEKQRKRAGNPVRRDPRTTKFTLRL